MGVAAVELHDILEGVEGGDVDRHRLLADQPVDTLRARRGREGAGVAKNRV